MHILHRAFVISGIPRGSILSWENTNWAMSRISRKEYASASIFCRTPSRKNFFIFPEMRTKKQAEAHCTTFGKLGQVILFII
jgi:hypothetical protein